jgi:hypothetical protein
MQRYHPDKNPNNAEIAAHAVQVVQAYEVLSDLNKRAAYNIKLKRQLADNLNVIRDRSGGRRPTAVAKDKKSYWTLWLLIALTILFGLFAMSLLRNTQSSESELKGIRMSLEGNNLTQEQIQKQIQEQSNRIDEILGAYQEIPGQESSERMNEVSARTIPIYISNLTVELNISDGFSGDAARILNIPILGVKVGAFDAEKVLRFVHNNKDLIRKKLEEELVNAKYDELIKVDGEQYLKNIVMDSIGDTTGTNRYKDDPIYGEEASGRYGVVDILLPRSFSVH